MTTTRTWPAVNLAVSLADIQNTLKMSADELSEIESTMSLTVRALAKEAEGQVHRSFINQGRRVVIDSFPDACGGTGAIRLDDGPVVGVDALKFVDADGVEQTLDPQDYYVDKADSPGWIVPAPDKGWPTTLNRISAVTVDYTCGYGLDDTAVPEEARQYILLRLADLWDPASRKFGETAASAWAERLLDSLRVYA